MLRYAAPSAPISVQYGTSQMRDPREQLRLGVFWLGSANLAAQVLDAASLFVVLAFLSKEDLGIATLAWSIAVILEAFNGLGTGAALLQAPTVSKVQAGSVFWYAVGLGLVLAGAMSAMSPLIADFYGNRSLAPMVVVSALKLPIVSAALVPLHLLNRDLKFRDLALIQTASTFLSAVVKIVLAVWGLGAWALVWANTAFGVFTLAGALMRRPFVPSLRFSFSEIRGHVKYGLAASVHAILYHAYRNLDFLVVGRVLGNEALGVYRVAFDVAMTPSQAVQMTVGRTAFPVFTRMVGDRPALVETFVWTERGLAFVTAAIALFVTFGGHDLLEIVGPNRWGAALPTLTILAWAAVLRSLGQLFPELYKALGRPVFALYASVLTFVLLSVGFGGGLFLFPNSGTLPVAWTWFVVQAFMLFQQLWLARRLVPLRVRHFAGALFHPSAAVVVATVPSALLVWARSSFPQTVVVSWVFVPVLALVIVLVFWRYLHRVLGLTLGGLLGRTQPKAATRRSEAKGVADVE